MTDEQKNTINQLRLQGLGYKAIANRLDLTRDVVRYYCKHHGLGGDACTVRLNFNQKLTQNIICPCCHKPIRQKGKGRVRRFCSDVCRRKWWKEHQEAHKKKETAIYSFNCVHCGKAFRVYGNKNRKYCSHACYIKHRFWRNEEDGI